MGTMNVADTQRKYNTKSFAFDFSKAADDGDERIFEGLASTFGNTDRGDDIVERGAFKQTIKTRFPAGLIKILWNHNSDSPIGVPIEMKEKSEGLWVKGRIANTQKGDEVLTLMKEGVITHMSIGFRIVKFEIDNDSGTWTLKELELFEFSPVSFPMNEMASIEAVKRNHNPIILDPNGSPVSSEDRIQELESTVAELHKKIDSLQAVSSDDIIADVDSDDDPQKSDGDDIEEVSENPVEDIKGNKDDLHDRINNVNKKIKGDQ